jgi:hypothetical protein
MSEDKVWPVNNREGGRKEEREKGREEGGRGGGRGREGGREGGSQRQTDRERPFERERKRLFGAIRMSKNGMMIVISRPKVIHDRVRTLHPEP